MDSLDKLFDKSFLPKIIRHQHEWEIVETSIALLSERCRCGATREKLN